jgi:preprotein translocase subunit SecF
MTDSGGGSGGGEGAGIIRPGSASETGPESSEELFPSVDDAARSLMRRREKQQTTHHGPLGRLYRGETRFDFVGRRRIWFALSTLIIVAGIISIVLRGGLNLGIEFKGGTEWTVPAPGLTQTAAVNGIQTTGLPSPIVELLGQGANQKVVVQADLNKLSSKAQAAMTTKVEKELATLSHTSVNEVENGVTQVGPTWGSQITNKAIEALIIFFIVVAIYISIRFEPKMALAAFIAMIHDILVAVGVYSLFNFQVTPDTVVAILTILGYSLYDTVVVFDRVRDNTKNIGSSGRMTYTQLINLSMNQTLARSINTSLVAILPVLAVLTVGAELFGATTLQDYGLALFVGLLSGAYSSIFIAAPILCLLKEREARWASISQRIATRGDRFGTMSAADAAAMTTQMSISAGGQTRSGGGPAKRSGPIRPGSGSGSGSGASVGTGTALMDRPAPGSAAPGGGSGSGSGATRPGQPQSQQPRPRKGKGKRKR